MRHKLIKNYVDSLPFAKKTGQQAFYYDTHLKGFGLRVGFASKAYIAETKIGRKTVRVTLGKHGALTVEQARKLAKAKLAAMSQNINPNVVEKEHKLKQKTLADAYEDYMAARQHLKPNTKRDYKKCMDKYLAEWVNKPLTDITRDMIEQKHQALTNNSAAQANMTMRFLRALFNFAAEYRDTKGQSIIGDNPVRRLSAKKIWNRIERRSTHIPSSKLKSWWNAVHILKFDPKDQRTKDYETIRDYLLVLIFTGLRREEALTLQWKNIDFKEKTLTIFDPKNHNDHTLPLGNFLFDLFERRENMSDSPWVFPGSGKTGRITEPRKRILHVAALAKISFSSHDLRRTFASIVNRLGDYMSYYTVKRLLNHKTADVTSAYIQHDIEKLREAMQRIEDYILEQVSHKP